MDNKEVFFKKIDYSITQILLLLFFTMIALNPLISFILNVGNIHIIISLLTFFLMLYYTFQMNKLKLNVINSIVFVYIAMVIIGILRGSSNGDLNIKFAIQASSYRVLYPIIFMMIFSLFNDVKLINDIGLNILKIINIICVILGLVGIIEKQNPSLVYRLYQGNITSHLTLIINGQNSSRLMSLAGNPINLGFYMAIGIGSAIALIFIYLNKSKVIVIFEVLNLLLFTYIIFMTYSRSAFLVAAVIGVSILLLILKDAKLMGKIIILLLLILIYYYLSTRIFSLDSFNSRFSSMNLTSYFNNTRYLRAYNAFDKDNSLIQLVIGHGISELNESNSYVFELGYASLLYESGIIGVATVIGSFVIAISFGLKNLKFYGNGTSRVINIFYISIIISGFAGMFVEDLYMQQPYSVYLWFSTIYLTSYFFSCKN